MSATVTRPAEKGLNGGALRAAVPPPEGLGRYKRNYNLCWNGGALFYLDPPYWDCEGDYGAGVFSRPDFERLADQLYAISGKFILSINDAPGVREVFSRFAIEEVRTTYTIGTAQGSGQRVGELIVSGGGER